MVEIKEMKKKVSSLLLLKAGFGDGIQTCRPWARITLTFPQSQEKFEDYIPYKTCM